MNTINPFGRIPSLPKPPVFSGVKSAGITTGHSSPVDTVQFGAKSQVRFGSSDDPIRDISERRGSAERSAALARREAQGLRDYQGKEDEIADVLSKEYINNKYGIFTGDDVFKSVCEFAADYYHDDLVLRDSPGRGELFRTIPDGERPKFKEAFSDLIKLGLVEKKLGTLFLPLPMWFPHKGYTLTPLGDHVLSVRNPDLYERKKTRDAWNGFE